MERKCSMEEIKDLMWSFTEAMAEAIDARTPYNAHHVRMVADYVGKMADYINEQHEKGLEEEYFSPNRKEQLVLGALMHDVGKIAVPANVMNKASRLEGKLQNIRLRFALFHARYQIQYLQGELTKEVFEQKCRQLCEILSLAEEVDRMSILTEEKRRRVENVLEVCYEGCEGIEPYFTEEEKECLLIQRGTLTAAERQIMESHVEITERILNKVDFNSQYENIKKWAVQHHEYLDGTGYPKHLRGEQLSLEARMLTVADICDSLLATDRPYKKPLPKEEAFGIMYNMAKQGKLDEKVVSYLEQSIDR